MNLFFLFLGFFNAYMSLHFWLLKTIKHHKTVASFWVLTSVSSFFLVDWSSFYGNWFFTNVLPNLIVGIIISLFGLAVWKWQFYYQKKIEVYAEMIVQVYKMEVYLKKAFNKELKGLYKEKASYDNFKNFPLAQKFIIYFGTSYQDTLYDLMNLLSYCLKDNSDKEIDIEKEKIINSSQEEFERYLEKRRLKIYKAIKRKQ